ncbi:uncharacterized protein LOC116351881 [Contarinia nasturtii]|uniref:uncharacterized protein LOC116351881 n=1 Tax=Contarinia nasturtii TaxID=265458 RepID=UPI0012D44BFC|nr:uncharacterized protein LOC116351881 [Contarinia nasturtii]
MYIHFNKVRPEFNLKSYITQFVNIIFRMNINIFALIISLILCSNSIPIVECDFQSPIYGSNHASIIVGLNQLLANLHQFVPANRQLSGATIFAGSIPHGSIHTPSPQLPVAKETKTPDATTDGTEDG